MPPGSAQVMRKVRAHHALELGFVRATPHWKLRTAPDRLVCASFNRKSASGRNYTVPSPPLAKAFWSRPSGQPREFRRSHHRKGGSLHVRFFGRCSDEFAASLWSPIQGLNLQALHRIFRVCHGCIECPSRLCRACAYCESILCEPGNSRDSQSEPAEARQTEIHSSGRWQPSKGRKVGFRDGGVAVKPPRLFAALPLVFHPF